MRGIVRVLMVVALLAALPLRGYAAIAAGLCDAHHGSTSAGQAAAHDHGASGGDDHAIDASAPESSGFSTVCSLCATCSVGASLAPHPAHALAFAPAGATVIPFCGSVMSGRVPGTLDRPPLPL